MGGGLSAHLIAKRLGVSPHTVRSHRQSLMSKFKAHSQVEIVLKATRMGLFSDPPDAGDDVQPDLGMDVGA